MTRRRVRLAFIAAGFVSVLVIGTVGYIVLEGWSPVEAVYMTVITLTTVGFGEVHPLSKAGQIFTTGLIVLGVGLVAYTASVIGEFLLDGSLANIVRRRRMQRRIAGLQNHFIVCGCGRTGAEVVAFLRERKVPFVVIDHDQEVVNALETEGVPVLIGNAHDNEVLEQAGLAAARGVIACAGDDAENVFIALTARSMRGEIPIAARCEQHDSEAKLRRAGATHVVNPYAIAGRHLISSVYRPQVTEFLQTTMSGGSTDFQELVVGPETASVGRTIGELGIGRDHRVSILALRRNDGTVVSNPGASTEIAAMDTLLALGSVEDLERLRAVLETTS